MLTRAAIAFIAFFLSLGAGVLGSLLGAAVAGLAFTLTLVAVILDFILFGVSEFLALLVATTDQRTMLTYRA